MANMCLTEYTINCPVNEADILYQMFIEARDKVYVEKVSRGWLGNLLYFLGEQNRVDNPDVCRGHISWIDRADLETIHFDTETANRPMPAAVIRFVKKFAPNAEIMYASDAGVCELYSNDPAIIGQRQYGGKYEERPLEEWLY